MQNFLLFILCLAVGGATYHYAKQRGRNPQGWFIIGFLFGIFGLLFLFLLPSKKNLPQQQSQKKGSQGVPLDEPQMKSRLLQNPLIEAIDPAHISKLWYYLDGANQQFGPMSINALSNAWQEGKVTIKTYVWNEELENWRHFEEVLKPLAT
jgi:hypothetical protein